jgi:hypothetical protein
MEEEIRGSINFEQIVGNNPVLKHILELVETVAPNDSTVLLLGSLRSCSIAAISAELSIFQTLVRERRTRMP